MESGLNMNFGILNMEFEMVILQIQRMKKKSDVKFIYIFILYEWNDSKDMHNIFTIRPTLNILYRSV